MQLGFAHPLLLLLSGSGFASLLCWYMKNGYYKNSEERGVHWHIVFALLFFTVFILWRMGQFPALIFSYNGISQNAYALLSQKNNSRAFNEISGDTSCVDKIERRKIDGDSLSGLAEDGSIVAVLYGFYECNPVQRGDMLVYVSRGSADPLIKLAKGIPGDTFGVFREDVIGTRSWRLYVNDSVLANSIGQVYRLNAEGSSMISIYARNYGNIIPDNTYLILGNVAIGSLDSTAFGLIDRSDIVGKAVNLD